MFVPDHAVSCPCKPKPATRGLILKPALSPLNPLPSAFGAAPAVASF
jgi:hypothetical protein